MRIKYELLQCVCSYTVTLTYDNENLPELDYFVDRDPFKMSPHDDNPDCGYWYHPYDVSHVQKFFKRLRKDGFQFRYFGVAEYGGKRGRPHYHIIFFFKEPVSLVRFQTEVFKQWPYGSQISIDITDDSCIGYTLKYCLKFYNVVQPSAKIFLSKRPFIGEGYFKPTTVHYLHTHPGDVVPTLVGVQRLPRLFRNKLYSDDEKEQNKNIILGNLDKMNDELERMAELRCVDVNEIKNRQRAAFTRKCVAALKKKSL